MNLFKFKLFLVTRKPQECFLILKNFSTKRVSKFKNIGPCDLALKHFDDFYKAVFADHWPSVRLALLSQQKYFAVINNFGEVEKTEKYLQNLGAFNLRSFLEVQKDYVHKLDTKCISENKNKTELDEVVMQKLQQETEKESHLLHPEGMEFQSKVDNYNQQSNETEKEEEYVYHIEDSRSSLISDFEKAEFDTRRLILPDSSTDINLQEFIPATKLRGAENFIPESEYYKYYKEKSEAVMHSEEEDELDFPEILKVYSFYRGEVVDFSEPFKCVNNVYNYLKVDGAELLVALALNVQEKDRVLDLCSTSGNVAYCLFQTLRPKFLVCTLDIKGNTYDLFDQYLYDRFSLRNQMLYVTSSSVNEVEHNGLFDKVLVDVPCTFDKTALFEEENNMFHVLCLKERLQLPKVQCDFLVKGLKLVRPGGTVIYTTSTLSPVQNEGVVTEALKILWKECKLRFTVKNLSPALQHTTLLFNYGDYLNLKYGTLVVPFLPMNFGPRYICKLVKNETQNNEDNII